MSANTIESIFSWFKKARPQITGKNLHTQMGVHFEEVSEMCAEITGLDGETRILIEKAKQANHNLAEHLKANEECVVVKLEDRKGYIDALCDQIVTAIGTAYDHSMDIEGALEAVSIQNWTKFDENGDPIFDKNGKIMKGPNYQPADLRAFI